MRPALIAVAWLVAANAAAAQAAEPKKPAGEQPALDVQSQATLARWRQLEYHPGRAGATAVTVTVRAKVQNPLARVDAQGSFRWQAGQGTLTWQDAKVTKLLARHGWTAQAFASPFDPDHDIRALGTAQVTAKTDGETTVLQVQGATPSGIESLRFDAAGRLVAMKLRSADSDTPETMPTVRYRYAPLGGQYLRTGWEFEVTTPDGTVRASTALSHANLAGFRLMTKAVETLRIDGKVLGTQTLLLEDHEVEQAGDPALDKTKIPDPKKARNADRRCVEPG